MCDAMSLDQMVFEHLGQLSLDRCDWHFRLTTAELSIAAPMPPHRQSIGELDDQHARVWLGMG
jgi:hypothetical protein